jgi:glycosyltransferase involved in cell wall biosynthesis
VQPLYPFTAKFSSVADKYLRSEKTLKLNLFLEMNRRGFDLLHVHSPYPSGYCAVKWGRQNQIPVVITCHGGDMPQMHKTDCGALHLPKKVSPKGRYALQQGNIITVPSKYLMKNTINVGCVPEKVRHVPNGIDIKSFIGHNHEKSDKDFILAMGRFEKIKGFDLLLEAFHKVAQVNKKVGLVVAGYTKDEDSQKEKRNLLDFTSKHKLDQRISFKAFQLGADKIALLKDCLFFVCPSRTESFGLMVLEAMAAGKPIVAFDVGGLSEIVQSGINGILVKPYDTAKLAEAMFSLLDNPQLQAKMSAASKQIASGYDWSIIAKKYLAVYDDASLYKK